MKLFLDTAVIDEIRTVHSWGVLDGVTTNPTLFAMAGGGSYEQVLEEICGITSGPVSAEVIADDLEGILREGRAFTQIAPNIVIKVPMSEVGLSAISRFAEEGIKTNCTLIFSAAQGLLAAKAGAWLLSPFVGRLDDINQDGMEMIRELAAIIEIHGFESEVLVASVRSPRHVIDGALAGAGVATLPFKVFKQMVHHPLDGQGHQPVQGRLGQGHGGGRQALTRPPPHLAAGLRLGRRAQRRARGLTAPGRVLPFSLALPPPGRRRLSGIRPVHGDLGPGRHPPRSHEMRRALRRLG